MDFALIFSDVLQGHALHNDLPHNQIPQQEDTLIQSRFLIPIFNKIKENPLVNTHFIQIIARWVLLFDQEAKEKLIKLMKDQSVYNLVFTEVNIYPSTAEADDQHLALFEEAQTLLLGINESTKTQPKPKNSNFVSKIIPESMFELHKNSKGEKNKKLVIYTSANKEFCYCYFWKKGKTFRCYSCKDKKRYVTARLCENKDGQKYVELNGNEHACTQRNYQNVLDEANKRQPPISFIVEQQH
uniref:FLYWCH-type domain-containing protein n=1 Tax=Panagrolaimus sp. ES5 TaxID=591445 RepID=A0AC34G095_9BILA